MGTGTVSVFDTKTMAEVATLPAGKGCHGVTLSPEGGELWTANVGENTVTIIDTATRKQIGKIDSMGKKPMLVEFSPDGRRAFVSNGGTADVAVFDARSRKFLKSIFAGKAVMGIESSRDGKHVWVTEGGDRVVSVLGT
ncbi:MAG TPA: hypothetical protein DDZ83_00875, partial [Nitrospinae bacterium]|nr:hypothetical protein [Nitrospinota bacterium]